MPHAMLGTFGFFDGQRFLHRSVKISNGWVQIDKVSRALTSSYFIEELMSRLGALLILATCAVVFSDFLHVCVKALSVRWLRIHSMNTFGIRI